MVLMHYTQVGREQITLQVMVVVRIKPVELMVTIFGKARGLLAPAMLELRAVVADMANQVEQAVVAQVAPAVQLFQVYQSPSPTTALFLEVLRR
jgi:hypothetical protein